MLPYEWSSALAKAEGIETFAEFTKWKKPPGVPTNPRQFYMKQGLGFRWSEFLGTQWLSYDETQALAIAAGIGTRAQYVAWVKPKGVPSRPWDVYAGNGWSGLAAFLCTDNIQGFHKAGFLPFSEARLIVRSMGFKKISEFLAWKPRPMNLPSNPRISYYGKGWVSWDDYLGNTPEELA